MMFIDRYRLSMMPNEAIIFTLSNDEMSIMEKHKFYVTDCTPCTIEMSYSS